MRNSYERLKSIQTSLTELSNSLEEQYCEMYQESAVLMILKNSDGCLLSMTIHCCNNTITYNERKY